MKMTSPIIRPDPGDKRRAFTLIELILVLGMLGAVIALAAPRLARFYRGRAIEIEANRFLTLTRFAQNRAISTGVPVVVWLNHETGYYGLQEEGAAVYEDPLQRRLQASRNQIHEYQPVEFQLATNLSFQIDPHHPLTNQIATIRFLPDGAIDENSLAMVLLCDEKADETPIPIVPSRNRLHYEITEPTNLWFYTTR